jgi:hypothetical protein
VDHVVGVFERSVKSTGFCVVGDDNKVQLVGRGIQSSAQRLDLRFTSNAQPDILSGFEGRQRYMSANEPCGSGDEDG